MTKSVLSPRICRTAVGTVVHRDGGEHIPMSTSQVGSAIKPIANELSVLSASPTMPAAPGWAVSATLGGDDIVHEYESPVPIGVHGNNTARPVVRCAISLAQLDYLDVENGRVVRTDRQTATVDIAVPDGLVSIPVTEARVLQAVLGGLISRYDSAESPATSSREVGPWPCLPNCDDDHLYRTLAHECSTYAHIGTMRVDSPRTSIGVTAITYSENADTYPTVTLERSDQHPDSALQITSAEARELTALLLAAADKADALTVRSAIPRNEGVLADVAAFDLLV